MKRIVFSVISAVILCSMLVFCVGASSQKSVFVDFKETYGFSVAQCESYSFNDNNGILSGTAAAKSEAVIAVRAADATGYASEVAEVTTAPVVTAPVVLGAQLRVPQSADDKVAQGLRFVSKITPEVYSMLSEAGIIPDSAADTGLGFGTVVIPQSLIPTGQKLTKETANAYISPAVKLFDGNISSEVKYTVCVIDIPEKKYTTKYTVVPYITYMDGDKEVTVYGEEFTASVYQIAKVAVGSGSQESTFVKNYINNNIINYVDQNEGWTDGIYRP